MTDRTVITKAPPPKSQWPEWMRVAEKEIGVRETPGEDENPRVIEYLKATRLDEQALNEDSSWCSAFVSWCLEQAGYPNPRYAMARNYRFYGERIDKSEARFGDIVIFRRGSNERKGHVGFFVMDLGGDIEILSGNSRNSVRYSHESKDDLIYVQRPVRP
jgi:uncharacterized protein (TIGR02594 family)